MTQSKPSHLAFPENEEKATGLSKREYFVAKILGGMVAAGGGLMLDVTKVEPAIDLADRAIEACDERDHPGWSRERLDAELADGALRGRERLPPFKLRCPTCSTQHAWNETEWVCRCGTSGHVVEPWKNHRHKQGE